MKFRKGKAVEWQILRHLDGREWETWDSYDKEREARRAFLKSYSGGSFALVKVTYELVPSDV